MECLQCFGCARCANASLCDEIDVSKARHALIDAAQPWPARQIFKHLESHETIHPMTLCALATIRTWDGAQLDSYDVHTDGPGLATACAAVLTRQRDLRSPVTCLW